MQAMTDFKATITDNGTTYTVSVSRSDETPGAYAYVVAATNGFLQTRNHMAYPHLALADALKTIANKISD